MEYTTLGRTGLRVSVAGLGCGGNSRIGLGAGKSTAESVALIKAAVDLGVNFFDTAMNYGTEPIVGAALNEIPRDSVIISTKSSVRRGERFTPDEVAANLDQSLKNLGTDCVDIYLLHGVAPDDYEYALNDIAPRLLREKEKGKFRFLGITETAVRDPLQKMLDTAVDDPHWDVVMLAYHMMNQNARHNIFPKTVANNVGTLLMFVVRNIFSIPGRLEETIQGLIKDGELSGDDIDAKDPLGFLVYDGGADSVVDAAYRFGRHQAGADIVLFGTGSIDHLKTNIESILKPPLPAKDTDTLHKLFGRLQNVGLDAPEHMKPK